MSRESHHAHLLVTDGASGGDVCAFVSEHFGVSVSGNPDFFHIQADTLGVEEVRRVNDLARRAGFSGDGTFFLIEAAFFTREAQNALLKTLEDPALGATFVIATSAGHLLPTVRSRLNTLAYTPQAKPLGGRAFLEMNIPERMKTIAKLAEEKDRAGALNLLAGLESTLYGEFRSGNAAVAAALRAIVRARAYLGDTGSSVKMLLENVVVAIGQR